MTALAWFLTAFADQGVMVPMSLAMTLVLWALGWPQGAKGWLIATVGTLTAIVAAKIIFYIFTGYMPFHLVSPSSHAAAGAMVYGSLLALVLRGGRAGVRTAIVTSSLFAIGFSATRLKIGAHSNSEVIVGSILGILGTIAFVKIAGRMPTSVNRLRLAGATALVVLALYGHRWDGETMIRTATSNMRQTLGVQ
jgi:membrane-associated phospholipid phosphatase